MFNGNEIDKAFEAQTKLIGCLSIFAVIGFVALVVLFVWLLVYLWNHLTITLTVLLVYLGMLSLPL